MNIIFMEEERLESELIGYNTLEKRKKNDEVFTPPHLINEMLDQFPEGIWSDPSKTWLDPCAGLGNFSVQVLKRLMEGLKDWQPDPELRKKHILEKMLFHVEMNPESVAKLQKVLNPEGKYTLNVHCGDFLSFADAMNSKKGRPLF
jgi:type I restriction-modification system DNA methylase subunit